MALGTNAPVARQQFFDDNGDPLANGLVYYRQAGLETLATVYYDANMTAAQPNPVELDSAGRAEIWLPEGSYDVAVHTADDVLMYETLGVAAVAPFTVDTSLEGVAGESIPGNSAVFMSDGTGGRTAGRWYKGDSGATATSTTPVLVGWVAVGFNAGTTGHVRYRGIEDNISGLTAGTTYYIGSGGLLTATPPANARVIGVALTSTALVLTG